MLSIKLNMRILFATVGLAAAVAGTEAYASTVYESAGYSGIDYGDYVLSDYDVIGAAFTITQQTQITGIGAQFGAYNGGTIFGAIVPLASLNSRPAGGLSQLGSIALADTVFTVPSGTTALDYTVPVSVSLNPGTYAVVFGSGLFGAEGYADLGDYNNPEGSPNLFRAFFSNDFQAFDDNGVRLTVAGSAVSPVPLPAALPLLAGALGGAGFVARLRKRNKTSV